MQENKNTLHRLIVAIVALIGLAVSIFSFVLRLNNALPIRSFALAAVYYGFVFFYGIYGYKKPHGNMVRYLLLILAIYIAYSITIMVERWHISGIIFSASTIVAVLIGYMAGRLNKYTKNIVLVAVISVLLLIKCLWPLDASLNVYPLFELDRTMPLFMWLTVMFIYFFRYKEHKLAGKEADSEDED